MSATTIATNVSASGIAERTASAPRNLAINYLRAFITLLVLAHHAALAYHPFAPRPALRSMVQAAGGRLSRSSTRNAPPFPRCSRASTTSSSWR